jgi:PBP1b-binding outer membrane lipoprotein LpoB
MKLLALIASALLLAGCGTADTVTPVGNSPAAPTVSPATPRPGLSNCHGDPTPKDGLVEAVWVCPGFVPPGP